MVDVAVVGAAGYAGIEAVRLVLGHPRLRLVEATSATDAGARLDDVYPALSGCTDLRFTAPDVERIAGSAQLAFLAVPHTAALELVGPLLERGVAVIDASADFRLRDPAVYETWYETPHTAPHLLDEAVYGLPELNRAKLAGARLVACPGCYPTAAALAAIPALEAGLVRPERVFIDAKSGVSGAGRGVSPTLQFCVVNENLTPYKVAAHRHTPEIEQTLSQVAGTPVRATFAPHLVPMTRGMLVTLFLETAGSTSLALETVEEVYRSRYADEPFVTVHAAGRMPGTREVCGTNRAHIGLALDGRTQTLIVVCAIDNLVKGTSGQAIQCANIMLGFDETEGLGVSAPVV